jgi:hypothetical protein
MNELLTAFRRFIGRDLVLLVSGGAVVATFLYVTGRVPSAADSSVVFVLLAGIGYFVAYAIQDGFSLTGISTTASEPTPNRFIQWLFKRYTREEWQSVALTRQQLATIGEQIQGEAVLARLERIVMLKQVCTAGGPSFLLCAGMLLLNWYRHGAPFDAVVGVVAALLAILLITLGWLKAAQQAQFIARHSSTPASTA